MFHYLVKFRNRSSFTTMNSFWVLHPAQKIIVRPQNHSTFVTVVTLDRSESIVPRSWTSMNWNYASTASGPLWVTRLLNVLFASAITVYTLAFVLEANILSTHCNKDGTIWQVRLFERQ